MTTPLITFVAKTAADLHLIRVSAESEEAARVEIADQLKRPGRYYLYLAWVDGGSQIEIIPGPEEGK